MDIFKGLIATVYVIIWTPQQSTAKPSNKFSFHHFYLIQALLTTPLKIDFILELLTLHSLHFYELYWVYGGIKDYWTLGLVPLQRASWCSSKYAFKGAGTNNYMHTTQELLIFFVKFLHCPNHTERCSFKAADCSGKRDLAWLWMDILGEGTQPVLQLKQNA